VLKHPLNIYYLVLFSFIILVLGFILQTGLTTLTTFNLTPLTVIIIHLWSNSQMLILIALMFKIGGAPLHLWMVDIYSGKRQLLMYLSTAPKLSLFIFWVSTWHSVWTVYCFIIRSIIYDYWMFWRL
jgi:NADH:ubiquinone oxidoreductase subunit 2 (subunit N)